MEEGLHEKRQRTERSGSEMEKEAGGETSQSSSQLQRKKGNMTNIYLTDSSEGVKVNFVKDHDKLYDKTNVLLKNKPRKDSL